MVYIKRDENNKIFAVYDSPQPDASESLSISSPELIEFLKQSEGSQAAQTALSSSDLALIRVLEDLINTLMEKKVIMFTDLPLAAREKLANREKIRDHLTELDDLVSDDPGLL